MASPSGHRKNAACRRLNYISKLVTRVGITSGERRRKIGGLLMHNIVWVGVSNEKVTDHEIEQVEKYFNIKLPNDFIECVKKYDGGYPRPKIFDVPGQDENVFNDLLTFHIEDEYSIVKIMKI